MAPTWIAINKKLLDAIQIVNSISTDTFTDILTQIVNNFDEPYSSEELERLEDTLKLNANNLQLLIQSIIHIYKKASKILIKPTVLQKQLTEQLQFDSDKAEEFVKMWTKLAKDEFGDIDKRKKVDNISWELNLESHSSKEPSKNIDPKARLCFGLSDFNGSNEENVTLELNERELLELYKTLENVQCHIDSISANK